MMYWAEKIDGGYRYWWVRCEEVRNWLVQSGIEFEDYPAQGRYTHDVFDAATAAFIKLAWHGR